MVFLRNLSFIGVMMSETSSSLPSNAHLPVTWKSYTSAYATSGGVPESSAATVFGIMSCTGYCDSSTLTPVFASYFLMASNSASSSDL